MKIYGIIFLVLFISFFVFIIATRIINGIINRRSSEKEVNAKVAIKKCSTSKNTVGIENELYYVVFERENHKPFKCYVKHRIYISIKTEEEGLLTYKGKKFVRFTKKSGEVVE